MALNANLAYTVYGLVTGGRGWEQYGKDNPQALKGVPEAEQSHVIMQASWRHFTEHPFDLAWGLAKGQVLGPVQTFAQIVRLAFLGAAADPLRIIPPAAIIIISLCFAGVLWCRWVSRARVLSGNGNVRLFCMLFLVGYLVSIPFFYKDGGLRLHAAVLPALSYLLVWVLLPPAYRQARILFRTSMQTGSWRVRLHSVLSFSVRLPGSPYCIRKTIRLRRFECRGMSSRTR